MVVTEEIVKCWTYSDRPIITHCLITGTLHKGYGQHPYVSDVLSELMSPTPIFGIKMKSSNSFVSMNVIKISRMN